MDWLFHVHSKIRMHEVSVHVLLTGLSVGNICTVTGNTRTCYAVAFTHHHSEMIWIQFRLHPITVIGCSHVNISIQNYVSYFSKFVNTITKRNKKKLNNHDYLILLCIEFGIWFLNLHLVWCALFSFFLTFDGVTLKAVMPQYMFCYMHALP